jgi:hypothetical protein
MQTAPGAQGSPNCNVRMDISTSALIHHGTMGVHQSLVRSSGVLLYISVTSIVNALGVATRFAIALDIPILRRYLLA